MSDANHDCKKATDRIMSDLAQQYHINGSLMLSSKTKKHPKKISLQLFDIRKKKRKRRN